jgi:Immunity protein family (Imm11)
MTQFFQMRDDVHVPGRWFLVNPVDGQGRNLHDLLMDGRRLDVKGPIRLQYSKHAPRGMPVDYSELAADIVPVVHARVATNLVQIAPDDIQAFPVEIEGQPDQFFIINVTKVVKCIDDERSKEVRLYTQNSDEVFRHLIGEYESVIGMRIDPTKVTNARIFRPWGWPVAIIVAEEIKQALERIGTGGVRFEEM